MKSKLRDKFVSQRLLSYAKSEYRTLSIGLLFNLARTGAEIVAPMLIAYILNNFIKLDLNSKDIENIAKFLGLFLIVSLFSGIFSSISRVYYEKAANNIAFKVQKDVYSHISNLPISYFDNLPAGSVVAKITNDTKKLKSMFEIMLSNIITSGIIAIAMYIILFITNKIAALLLLILVPLLVAMFVDLRYKSNKNSQELRAYNSDINSKLNEDIQNMEIIKAFNQEDYIKNDLHKTNLSIFKTQQKITKLYSYNGYVAMNAIQNLVVLLILIYFGYGNISNKYVVSIGSMYMVINYSQRLFSSLNTIFTEYGTFEQAYASAIHVFDIFKIDGLSEIPENNFENRGDVIFKDVRFAYREEEVLKGINFSVDNGQSIAFVGATGSGKSTIINLLLKFYETKSGEIYISDREIKNINRNNLRKDMAVVLQDPFIFETTIRENINMYGNYSDEEIKEALIAVGGENLVKRGIEQKIIEKGANLSQGEKQLIAFARAYIRNPKILILDEATSNIDTESEKIIQKGIEKLKENRTTFIVAHRLSTIKDVDKIIVLKNGIIVEEGNHESLMSFNSMYRKMYENQIEDLKGLD